MSLSNWFQLARYHDQEMDLKNEMTIISQIKSFFVIKANYFKKQDDKTYTFAGTPEYLAPEIVLNKGHNKNVDLWGIGVFLYELVAGYPPFQDKNRNYDKISKQIVMNRPTYPETFSPNLKDLIKQLLNSDPQMRLGANSFNDLKEHPFFYDIDWIALQDLKIESPIKKFTQQEKPTKAAVRPRPIFETPLQTNIKLPQILGMTYDQDEINQANKHNQEQDEDELLKYKFDSQPHFSLLQSTFLLFKKSTKS